MNTMGIRFVHMSDLHFLEHYSKQGFEGFLEKSRHPRLNIRNGLRAEKAQGLDFVLITGDLTQEGGDADFCSLKALLDEELGSIPVYVLPGNHDPRDAFCKAFFGSADTATSDRVYELRGLRIVTLDTGRGITGTVNASQLDWLREILSVPA
ncbi:MAG: metallophosphoesterase, partial [Acetanaerobacterium sp.]